MKKIYTRGCSKTSAFGEASFACPAFISFTVLIVFCFLVSGCGGIKVPGPAALTDLSETAWIETSPSVNQTEVLAPLAAGQEEAPVHPFVRPAETPGMIIEIREKMFIAQTNDVYLNPEDYLGKTIKLEGLFKQEQGIEADYCFVIRYGPGCCGYDGNAGFEVAWDTNQPDSLYPSVDDWVEAVGVLKSYEEEGYSYLYLALSSLEVKTQRGAEFVAQ
ncbi:MAG: hypothetical protein LBC62_04595 [Treponema sp.]|jgi:hypothetical protein|nr:hypothetical protein [Treponema sp.]